eukprot:6178730-Pleurochrysis_carterae.AAC.1
MEGGVNNAVSRLLSMARMYLNNHAQLFDDHIKNNNEPSCVKARNSRLTNETIDWGRSLPYTKKLY